MKKLVLGAIAALFIGTAATAEDFNNTEAFVTVEVDRFEFTTNADQKDGLTSLEAGVEVLSYNLSDDVTASLDIFGRYYKGSETGTLAARYSMAYYMNDLALYGSAEAEWVVTTNSSFDNDVFVNPEIGLAYALSDTVSAFGDVEYTWNATDSFSRAGGEVELGIDWMVASNVTFTPSVVHYFDTTNDRTEAQVGVTFNF
jgi:hypothetical protein